MRKKIGDNQVFHYHNPTGEFAIEHIEDIQPLLDEIAILREQLLSANEEIFELTNSIRTE